MQENFENIRSQVDIENIAIHLMGRPERGMFKYPDEKTASLKIYPKTQSFYDFGRNTGGDCIRLWSHVRGCDNWTSLQEICALYGISTDLNTADGKSIAGRIKAQEMAQKEHRQAEKRKWEQCVKEVERLQEWRKLCQNLLDSGHLPPFCDVRSWCYSEIQIADHKLDVLCGIE